MQLLAHLLIPTLAAAAALVPRDSTNNRAAYFMRNDPEGSSIVSLKISVEDGTLSNPVVTWTGGRGLRGLTASTNGSAPAVGAADTLFSQNSVVVSQDYLFTVNAGSHTVSMFFIDKNNPQHPTLIGAPASTMAKFPQSVAYSPRLKTVCVLNGGAVAGISCFHADHAKGLTPIGSLRPLSLNQTTPPVGPPGTASDLVFNPSQTALFATIKGNGVTPGFIYAYPVLSDGRVSSTPIISRPSELAIDFGLSFLSDSSAVIADPSFGSAVLDIGPHLEVSVKNKTVIAGESATCWTVYASRFDTAFVIDAGGNVTLTDPGTGKIKGTVVLSGNDKGGFDSVADREFLYILRGGPAVTVVKNEGLNHGALPKLVQSLNLSSLGPRTGFQGLAVYPSSGL